MLFLFRASISSFLLKRQSRGILAITRILIVSQNSWFLGIAGMQDFASETIYCGQTA